MAKAATSKTAVFAPPDLTPATSLRPEVVARLELLRIVWRPDRDAEANVKVCEVVERYLNGKASE